MPANITQAGAVVFRADASGPRILVVTAKRNSAHWLFPKGHVEPGESVEAAALREAYEEAGVSGTIVSDAGSLAFQLGADTYCVEYFLVVTRDTGRPEPGRSLEWCSYEEALDRLTFDDTRDLLRAVWPQIKTQTRA